MSKRYIEFILFQNSLKEQKNKKTKKQKNKKTKNKAVDYVGLIKFDTTREYDMNPTRFLRVWIEYKFV